MIFYLHRFFALVLFPTTPWARSPLGRLMSESMALTIRTIHDTTLSAHSRIPWFEYRRAILPAAFYKSPCMIYNLVGCIRLSFLRCWKYFDACIVLILPCKELLSFSELLVSSSSSSPSEDSTWALLDGFIPAAFFWLWQSLESPFFFDEPLCCSTAELSKLDVV
jgi:hypothetical protein